MNLSDLPVRFNYPFGYAAGGSYIRSIPDAHQTPSGSDAPASLEDGFPPECFLTLGSGGIPPNGKDFNGILNRLSAWARWQAAGGTVTYNATFSTKIGGYPKGALLKSSAIEGLLWMSTADANTTDPDGGSPSNWTALGLPQTKLLNANPGYRVHADGFKECWGTATIGAGLTATISLPVTHASWFNVSLAPMVKNTSQAQFNTGLLSKSGVASFTLVNWENVSLDVDWSTRGV